MNEIGECKQQFGKSFEIDSIRVSGGLFYANLQIPTNYPIVGSAIVKPTNP